jgi:hypothetical protein
MSSAPSPVADVLAGLADAFARLGARWYLFGAQAAILHGAARLTADVDVTIEPGDRGTKAIVGALEARGFELRLRDADDFVERTRVLPMMHRATGMPVDVVLAGPGPEELFLSRAEHRTVAGVDVVVAAADDLIAMKILSGRPRDHEDVTAVLRAQRNTLDIARARETLRLLERALDRADLVSEFERLLGTSRRA